MTGFSPRSTRRIGPLLLALGLIVSPVATPTVRAQDEAQPGEKKAGDPVPGYLGLGLLAMLAIFIVGKSARR